MPHFEVHFDDVGFTKDASLGGSSLSPTMLREFNHEALKAGWFPEGVLSVLGSSISDDDGQEDEDEIKVFASVRVLVEAADQRAANNFMAPDELLNRIAGTLAAGGADELGLEGNWEAIDAEPYEPTSFRYALVNRPAGLGTVPKGFQYEVEPRPAAGAPHHDMARHGVLVTPRALNLDEVRSFELSPLIDAAQIDELASRISQGGSGMNEYVAEYVALSREEPAEFISGVRTAMELLDPGVRYSVFDAQLLATLVARKLQSPAAERAVEAASPRQRPD